MSILVQKREKVTVENTPCEWKAYKNGVSFELYGAAHPLYQFAMARFYGIVSSQDILELDEHSLTGEAQLAIFAKYLVKDWKGVEGDDNEKLEVTPDNFLSLIETDPAVWDFVNEKVIEIQNDFNKKVEATKKKQSRVSNGK